MICLHCKKDIDIDNPERYFVKLNCPKCGEIIKFENGEENN